MTAYIYKVMASAPKSPIKRDPIEKSDIGKARDNYRKWIKHTTKLGKKIGSDVSEHVKKNGHPGYMEVEKLKRNHPLASEHNASYQHTIEHENALRHIESRARHAETNSAAKASHHVLFRKGEEAPWQHEISVDDKEDVGAEKESLQNQGIKAKHIKIIKSSRDPMDHVRELNAGERKSK